MTSSATSDQHFSKFDKTAEIAAFYGFVLCMLGSSTAIHVIFTRWHSAFYNSVGMINMFKKSLLIFLTIVSKVQKQYKLLILKKFRKLPGVCNYSVFKNIKIQAKKKRLEMTFANLIEVKTDV